MECSDGATSARLCARDEGQSVSCATPPRGRMARRLSAPESGLNCTRAQAGVARRRADQLWTRSIAPPGPLYQLSAPGVEHIPLCVRRAKGRWPKGQLPGREELAATCAPVPFPRRARVRLPARARMPVHEHAFAC
jgi:hypothetical protein